VTNLFVYGTLKRGFCRARFLDGQTFLREAISLPRYRLYDLGPYPGLVHDREGVAIQGELWQVDDATMVALDREEAVPILYQRGPILIRDCNEPVIAYFYQQCIAGMPDCGPCWPRIEE
jgi:gamma-glutamylcyclotransferase (GGCT)/AIG2-like uncharacterized protein YtfP